MNVELELDLAANMLGDLSEHVRARVRAFFDAPDEERWDDIYSIIVNPGGPTSTIWQAVIAVDPSFPRVGPRYRQDGTLVHGWERVPPAETVHAALIYATH